MLVRDHVMRGIKKFAKIVKETFQGTRDLQLGAICIIVFSVFTIDKRENQNDESVGIQPTKERRVQVPQCKELFEDQSERLQDAADA